MEDFKEIIYFALSMIAAVLIISLIGGFMSLTGDMSSARNEEIRMRQQAVEARKYGEYDGQTLCGVEVIALLRDNAVRKGECIMRVYSTDGSLYFEMDASNYALYTYTALTVSTSPIKIAPDSQFTASVDTGYRHIDLFMQ